MNTIIKPGSLDETSHLPEEDVTTVPGVEGDIREFVRRDLAGVRKLPHVDDYAPTTGNIGVMLERVSNHSITEIDNLIAELQAVRDFLASESDRVQREIANFTQVSQAATASAKVILDSMGQWKSAVGSVRREP
jgi:ABC-type ATPase with predicted acetyltransferase domain